jgi:hypothetical protein
VRDLVRVGGGGGTRSEEGCATGAGRPRPRSPLPLSRGVRPVPPPPATRSRLGGGDAARSGEGSYGEQAGPALVPRLERGVRPVASPPAIRNVRAATSENRVSAGRAACVGCARTGFGRALAPTPPGGLKTYGPASGGADCLPSSRSGAVSRRSTTLGVRNERTKGERRRLGEGNAGTRLAAEAERAVHSQLTRTHPRLTERREESFRA